MSKRLAVVVALSAILACSAEPTELNALEVFYKSDDPKAKVCAQYGALIAEAHDALGLGDPAEVAAKRLEAKYKQRVTSAEDQARVSRMMMGISNLAFGLRSLSKEGAVIAHLQMCRQQLPADWAPAFADFLAIDRKLLLAEGCEKDFPVGLHRKDCIARAFGSQT
jgi:hypothetical protein